MFLFQIFLHQEVKRNQNIMKGPLFGDLYRNRQPSKDAYTRLSEPFQFQAFFDVFLLFLDIKFIEFTSSRPFFKVVCRKVVKQKSSDRSFIFLNCTGFSKRRSLSHPFYHLGWFFLHSFLFDVTRCHSLSFVVIRCHSLSLAVPFVVTCCHSLSLVITRYTTHLSFYKRSIDIGHFINSFSVKLYFVQKKK